MRVRQRRHDLPRCQYDAVRSNRTYRHSVAIIGCSQEETARSIGHDVRHRVGERPGAGIRQSSGLRVDGKGDDRIWLVTQACVKELLVRADCEWQRSAPFRRTGDSDSRGWRQIAIVLELKNRDVLTVRIGD